MVDHVARGHVQSIKYTHHRLEAVLRLRQAIPITNIDVSLFNLIFPLNLHCKRLMGNLFSVFIGVVLKFRRQNNRKGRFLDPSLPCFLLVTSLLFH